MVPRLLIWVCPTWKSTIFDVLATIKVSSSTLSGYPVWPSNNLHCTFNDANNCCEKERTHAVSTSLTVRKRGCDESWNDTIDGLLDVTTYASLLRSCGRLKALSDGRLIHIHIIRIGLEENRFLTNLLVQMYGSCGSSEIAFELFSKMQQRDVFSWNFIIKGYAQYGQGKEALQLFKRMQEEGILPDKVLYVSILSACDNPAESKGMYAKIAGIGYELDIIMGTALIKLFGKSGSVEDARRIFDKMPEQDSVSWTAMIAVYAQHKLNKDALEIFDNMEQFGVKPDDVTFVSILSACASHAALLEGKHMHSRIVGTGVDSNVFVGNALLHMYSKCGSLEDAQKTFDKMVERDADSWTAVIAAYAQHGQVNNAIQSFYQMHQEGELANKVTLLSAIDACDNQAALEGKWIHSRIMCCGFESDLMFCNALVNMYGKCGGTEYAQIVFHCMSEKDLVSWNAMICVYTQNNQGMKALRLFARMQHEGMLPGEVTFVSILDACGIQRSLSAGKQIHVYIGPARFDSNIFVGTALVNMYGKCGSVQDAQMTFNKMHERDTVSWNALVAAYAEDEQGEIALQSFEQMRQEGVMPDKLTFISIISACASHVTVTTCKWIHASFMGSVFRLDPAIGNALINMYGKCGCLGEARKVFEEQCTRDIFSWNAMIAAYAQNGQDRAALQLFFKMQQEGVMPDKVTFVCILSACSHAGLLDEGSQFFLSMQQRHGFTPDIEHYNCMIDLLGRAGQLDEAEGLMHNMPFPPTTLSWLTLLAACRHHVDMKRGERAAEFVFRMDPEDVAPYILLSNMYVVAGRQDDSAEVLDKMKDRNLKPWPGCRLIGMTPLVHEFSMDNRPKQK